MCAYELHECLFIRVGSFDMLWTSENMRNGALGRAAREELREMAISNGSRTLRSGGIQKVRQETTTLLEVLHVMTG